MRGAGHQMVALPPAGFAWRRHGATAGHAFPVTDGEVRHLWARATVRDAGQWDSDIVDAAPDPTWPIVECDPEKGQQILAGLLRRVGTRQVIAPPPLRVGTGQITLRDLVVWAVDSSPRFAADLASMEAAERIVAAFAAPVATLLEDDWRALCEALSSPPEGRWPVSPPRVLLPMLRAVMRA
jgi:hypothetical protein